MCYNKMYVLKTPMVGLLAVSRMGHDKGRVYAVVSVIDADFVLCADGRVRTAEHPKKKRFKHLKLLGSSQELGAAILAGTLTDQLIIKTIQQCSVTDNI